MKNIKYYSLILLLLSTIARGILHKAVVIQSVADLAGQPIYSLFPHQSAQKSYTCIPVYSADILNNHACARLHQVLFNEIVEIIEQKGDEALIQIPNMFYTTHQSHAPHARYWIHKKALMPLHALAQLKIDVSKFPQPIRYKNTIINNKNIVTLSEPFYDSTTKQTYSAGTRFVTNQIQQKKNNVNVHIFDIQSKQFKTTHIPLKKCVCTYNKDETHKNFVTILQKWATAHKNSSIPYVWGGCSFINTYQTEHAYEQKKIIKDKIITFFALPKDNSSVKTGFDCTGMVVRAAQIAGIPYFFKNSTTVAQHLKSVAPHESISPGDIVWIPGHVMVVSDLEKNTIIEARAYNHGYGKIQEIPLSEEFKNMHTFAQLHAAIQHNKIIERLDKNGNTIQKINNMKILKLSSVWK